MKKVALITAGGSGSRMQAAIPKQFLEIAGKPVLMHTFFAFQKFAPDLEFVLVLPENHFDYWKSLCEKYQFHTQHQLAIAGPTRFHSVKSGLQHVADDSLVAIHDGVRPLVSMDTIARCFHHAGRVGNAIPVVAATESLRITENAISRSLPREKVRIVQTPQCFQAKVIKKAYNKNYSEEFTDDASVLEADGGRIFLVDGNPENIKITTSTDLITAEALLAARSQKT
jgi:2-C-methyl-D-erythritol 4-phosphate cytidylyltransferase